MKLLQSTKDHKKHFTATGYIINKERTKLLLIHHNKLMKWLPPGGHVDPDETPHECARREALEETGIDARHVSLDEYNLELKDIIDTQIPRPYAMVYQVIPKSKKQDEHIHMDMIYVLEADEDVDVDIQLKEVKEARWHTKEEVIDSDNIFDSVKGFAKLNLV